jgi:hypothetical protein
MAASGNLLVNEGGLAWREGGDGVWRAPGLGGVYAVKQSPKFGGARLWYIPSEGPSVMLGTYSTLGAAFGAARSYTPGSEPVAAEEPEAPAAEECSCQKREGEAGAKPGVGEVVAVVVEKTEKVAIIEANEETDPSALGHEAGEHAVVLYEKVGSAGPPAAAKPLRWHRAGEGYTAKGQLGAYTIAKDSSRQVRLALDGAVLAKLPTKAKAQEFAQSYEQIYPVAAFRAPVPAAHAAEAPRGAVCGPFAEIMRNPDAFAACKAAADKIGPIDSIADVYRLVAPEMHKKDNEIFLVIPLGVHHELREMPVKIGEGQRDRVTVDPADCLRAVILSGASSWWLVHSHPSGRAKPSKADLSLTEMIRKSNDAAFGKGPKHDPSVEFRGHAVIGMKAVGNASNGRVLKMP